MTSRILLTVSGTIAPTLREDIAAGRRPQADYLAIADATSAVLLDHAAARRAVGRSGRALERLVGIDILMAVVCWRRRRQYDTVVTDGENVGLPYAALCWFARRRPGHLMIGHRLSARKKVLLHRLLRLGRRIDGLLVYATAQRRFAVDRLGYRPSQVVVHPFMVDTNFWRPTPAKRPPARTTICSVGQEFRDYPTLVAAIGDLEIDVVIAAASPWSKRADSSKGLELPANVIVGAFDQYELRQLYERSALVVVPLLETDFQAGITTILESMSMALPTICSRTDGQNDTIVDGVTGVYVPPGDTTSLRAAVIELLDDPDGARALGEAARDWVCADADVEVYARDLAGVIEMVERAPRTGR